MRLCAISSWRLAGFSRGACIALAAAAGLFVLPAPASAQSCDPALPRNESQPSGYRPRGDRCEGVYNRQVAAAGIQLVSFTAASDIENLCTPGEPVHLVWARRAEAPAPVRVRAESLRQRLYYRLDLERPPDASAFLWAPAPRCNNDVRLGAQELGILARTPHTLGAKPVDLHLPVGLAKDPGARPRPPYRAVLVPGRRLAEMYVTVWRHGSDGGSTRLFAERPLGKSPYPAGIRIAVPLQAEELTQPGVYRVRTSVQYDNGDVEALEFYFFHAG